MNAEIVVYGASGYTGKLVSWQLAAQGLPFIAAGRSKTRLETELGQLPELKSAYYECVQADREEETLIKLFSGKKVVINTVGPFMQLSQPVATAALKAGCHYFDTTGEADWTCWLRDELGHKFKEKGLVCAPATSWMWQAGEMAAEIALETPGVDSLDLLYLGGADTSVASTMSFFRMMANDQHFKEHDTLEVWPGATAYNVAVPGRHDILTALPWGGGLEPIYYEQDERVRNCKVLTGLKEASVTQLIVDKLKMIEKKHAGGTQEELEAITNETGNALVSTEPKREQQDKHHCLVSCNGRGRTQAVTVLLHGNCPYIQTGIFSAVAAREALAGSNNKTGWTSAIGAFGYHVFMRELVERGYLTSKYVG